MPATALLTVSNDTQDRNRSSSCCCSVWHTMHVRVLWERVQLSFSPQCRELLPFCMRCMLGNNCISVRFCDECRNCNNLGQDAEVQCWSANSRLLLRLPFNGCCGAADWSKRRSRMCRRDYNSHLTWRCWLELEWSSFCFDFSRFKCTRLLTDKHLKKVKSSIKQIIMNVTVK